MTTSTESLQEICPAQLSDAQVERYWKDGYLAFEQALDASEVEAARGGLLEIVRRNAFDRNRCEYRAPAEGAYGNHAGATYHVRGSKCYFQIEPGQEPAADADVLETQVRKFMWFEDQSPFFAALSSSHAKTFGLVERLLGGAARLYQSMALVKPAHFGQEKPWHQDNAYFSVRDLDLVIGTWIALDDVDAGNGCMHVLPGGHCAGPLRHHHTFDCEIVPGRMNPAQAVPVPLRAGGMLLFHANLPHQTPPNRSDRRRRALQFHYRRDDNPLVPVAEFDQIFAEADGSPASCESARRHGF